VRDLVAHGTTVMLTTQYLEEADRLAHNIAVIDRGAVIAEGTPDALKSSLRGDRLEVVVRDAGDLGSAASVLALVAEGEPLVDREVRRVSAAVADRVQALTAVAPALRDFGIDAEDLAVRRPTLDEVFIGLTEATR
jgi:ABC-2 type transport system ATP-binding protein